jgi:hypothetical protein
MAQAVRTGTMPDQGGTHRRFQTVWIKYGLYGVLTLVIYFWGRSGNPVKVGLVNGLVLAEVFTWAVFSFWGFILNIVPITLEAVMYAVILYVFYGVFGLDLPREPEALAVAFLAFLLMATVKTTYNLAELLSGDSRDEGEV